MSLYDAIKENGINSIRELWNDYGDIYRVLINCGSETLIEKDTFLNQDKSLRVEKHSAVISDGPILKFHLLDGDFLFFEISPIKTMMAVLQGKGMRNTQIFQQVDDRESCLLCWSFLDICIKKEN